MSQQNGQKLIARFDPEVDAPSVVELPGTPEQIMRGALTLGYREILFRLSSQIDLELLVEEDLEFLLQAHLDIQGSATGKHIVFLGEGKLVIQAFSDEKCVVANVVYAPYCNKASREDHSLTLSLQKYRAHWNSVASQLLEQLRTAGLQLPD